jgi:hypothetical protein
VLDNEPDGDLSGYSCEEIAEEADWEGDDPEAFVDALLNCGKQRPDGTRAAGFLERDEDGHLIIHDS